jgi:hypothetical protein
VEPLSKKINSGDPDLATDTYSVKGMFGPSKVLEPDPVIHKAPQMPPTSLSVASTTLTISSPFKASFNDLSSLEGIPPIRLPHGALDTAFDSEANTDEQYAGGWLGKFSAMRKVSREMSIDSVISDDGEMSHDSAELCTRLLFEADRVSNCTGCHVKVVKLTTSKTNPYKTLLRHASP